jgi:hypothetical protein
MGCRGRGRVPFPCSPGIEACGLRQWRHLQFLAVKSGQWKLREVDREPAIVHRQQADLLAPQNFTQKHVVLLPTNNDHVAARCVSACYPDNPVRAGAPETLALTVYRPQLACASPALRADAPDYIPGESGPARAAARADWPLAVAPSPASACYASVRAFRSARDVRLRPECLENLTATAREDPRDGAEALRDTQAVCGFRCWASKRTPLFHTIRTMVAIFLARVSRAISCRMPLANNSA